MPDLNIEVIYALADAQQVARLVVPSGTRAGEAVALSKLQPAGARFVLGLFGRRILSDQQLREGDRVEILRPLAKDPMDARRQRARKRRS